MATWEYKVLSSGKMGMASMALLEQFLNDLGKQQWEIVNWQTATDDPLRFTGLARRAILRDWAPDEMPSAQRTEAELKREQEEAEKERDAWKQTIKEEIEAFAGVEDDDPEELTENLFGVLRPMLKRNQRGPGSSGSVEFLARRLQQEVDDLLGALGEAGLSLPEEGETEPVIVEAEGQIFWLNQNQRGEIWVNCVPKGQFRPPAPPKAREERAERARPQAPESIAPDDAPAEPAPVAPLPEGEALLERLRPLMRRNRRGQGLSGSITFLARALRRSDADLEAALGALGLALPPSPDEKPAFVEHGGQLYWLHKNDKGQVWIHSRDTREEANDEEDGPDRSGGERGSTTEPERGSAETAAPAADTPPEAPLPTGSAALAPEVVLAAIRPHFAKNRRSNALSARPAAVAEALGVSQADLVDALVRAGLAVPAEEKDKPVFVEHGGEIFWFNRNAKDELWLNAKPKAARRGSRGGRGRSGKSSAAAAAAAVEPADPAGEGETGSDVGADASDAPAGETVDAAEVPADEKVD
jgi:hypothetical protein